MSNALAAYVPKPKPNARGLRNALEKFVKRHDFTDVAFYSKKEWAARREPYNNTSPFVITFEGSMYEIVNDWRSAPAVHAELYEIIKRYGFYAEQGHSWNMGFYPNG